jgi:hypothetical protein
MASDALARNGDSSLHQGTLERRCGFAGVVICLDQGSFGRFASPFQIQP